MRAETTLIHRVTVLDGVVSENGLRSTLAIFLPHVFTDFRRFYTDKTIYRISGPDHTCILLKNQ
jgi:hypothetical protein